jgi:post-segregation antitoxin (ccd killing protein)
MPKTRVYVTVDRALLDELKQAAGKELDLSGLASNALRWEIRRIRHQAQLDEMDRERRISAEDDASEELALQAADSPGVPRSLA